MAPFCSAGGRCKSFFGTGFHCGKKAAGVMTDGSHLSLAAFPNGLEDQVMNRQVIAQTGPARSATDPAEPRTTWSGLFGVRPQGPVALCE